MVQPWIPLVCGVSMSHAGELGQSKSLWRFKAPRLPCFPGTEFLRCHLPQWIKTWNMAGKILPSYQDFIFKALCSPLCFFLSDLLWQKPATTLCRYVNRPCCPHGEPLVDSDWGFCWLWKPHWKLVSYFNLNSLGSYLTNLVFHGFDKNFMRDSETQISYYYKIFLIKKFFLILFSQK